MCEHVHLTQLCVYYYLSGHLFSVCQLVCVLSISVCQSVAYYPIPQGTPWCFLADKHNKVDEEILSVRPKGSAKFSRPLPPPGVGMTYWPGCQRKGPTMTSRNEGWVVVVPGLWMGIWYSRWQVNTSVLEACMVFCHSNTLNWIKHGERFKARVFCRERARL